MLVSCVSRYYCCVGDHCEPECASIICALVCVRVCDFVFAQVCACVRMWSVSVCLLLCVCAVACVLIVLRIDSNCFLFRFIGFLECVGTFWFAVRYDCSYWLWGFW